MSEPPGPESQPETLPEPPVIELQPYESEVAVRGGGNPPEVEHR
jgi:hypothetical protein